MNFLHSRMPSSRPVQPADLNQLVGLLDSIFRHDPGTSDQTVLTDFPLFFNECNLPNCRLIEENGCLVSHAGIWPRTLVIDGTNFKTAMVVLVATSPSHRLLGLAASLMRDLQQQIIDQHYDLGILWTAVPDFYRRLGWQAIETGGWILEDLSAADSIFLNHAAACDQRSITRFRRRDHLDDIVSLHDAEPVRFARSHTEYEKLLSLPKIHVSVLERNHHVDAYVAIGAARNKLGVIEYAGSADDILALIGHYTSQDKLPSEAPLVIYPHRDDLAKRLKPAGLQPLTSSKGHGIEMIYMTDPSRLATLTQSLFAWGLDYA